MPDNIIPNAATFVSTPPFYTSAAKIVTTDHTDNTDNRVLYPRHPCDPQFKHEDPLDAIQPMPKPHTAATMFYRGDWSSLGW